MAKALKETKLMEKFTEHDLRVKVASDNESERARQLLGHTSSVITDRIYRRKPELVKLSVRGGK
jgi:integrase